MSPPASPHPPIAGAFLALGDDPGPAPAQRTAPRVLGAAAATLVLALAGPLAWATVSYGEPRELPAAAAKASAPSPEDEADADDPRDDPPRPGTPWAATNA